MLQSLSLYQKQIFITEMGPFELTTKPEDYVFSDTIRIAEEIKEINFVQNA